MLVEHELEYVHMFEAPEPSFCPDPHGLLRGSASSNTNSSSTRDSIFRKSPRRRLKRKDSGITILTEQTLIRPLQQHGTTPHPSTAPEYDLCTLFLNYLENCIDPAFNELPALERLTHELSLLQIQTRTLTRQLTAMYEPRQHPQLHHHLVVQQRLRLATQLRLAREAFMAAGHGGLRAEQVIVKVVEPVMGRWWQGEVKTVLRRAFRGMEEEVGELGDRVMRGGGKKWVMGEFAAVDSLDGMKEE
ncbi:hypothetical protein SVAN01_01386 [Stagonosporopsis vannaccii]|nr:hypothetical protein SVAN01_01386 [Stagonosporopsis vannaccii]